MGLQRGSLGTSEFSIPAPGVRAPGGRSREPPPPDGSVCHFPAPPPHLPLAVCPQLSLLDLEGGSVSPLCVLSAFLTGWQRRSNFNAH